MQRLHLLLLTMLAGALSTPGQARAGDDLEYQVKAAMIYNFTRFVEWPPTAWKDARDPMIVGIIGTDPLNTVLEEILKGRSHAGHDIHVRHCQSVEGIEGCQLLFVAKSQKKHLAEILRASQSSGVLTVSDIEGFVQAGGMVGFLLESNRIRFEIGSASASKAGLVISSKLLSLAVPGGRS